MKINAIIVILLIATILPACKEREAPPVTPVTPVSVQPATSEELKEGNEDFPMANKAWGATLLQVKGLNSADATALGKVTNVNASEYCNRMLNADAESSRASIVNECIESTLDEEEGNLYSISANCIKKTITTSHLGTFVFTGRFESATGDGLAPWKDENTGELIDYTMASSGGIVDAQFALVCPVFKTWK